MGRTLLVVASTFPARDTDPVPAFVKDQVVAMHRADPSLQIHVLAPHDPRSGTRDRVVHEHYVEHRFHYFWPRSRETLAGRGILPALRQNPLNYALVPFLFLGEAAALYRLTRQLRPDLIYAHWFTPQGITARLVGAATRTPFAFTTHASDVAVWRKIPAVGPWIVRSNAGRARSITAVSRRSMDRLRQFFTDDGWHRAAPKAEIIPMGVDTPPTATTTAETRSILFVGRLAEKKGVRYLLDAFALARHDLPGWRLVVAGDGPLMGELVAHAEALDLTDLVEFPGYVTGPLKQRLLQEAAVHVVPSIVTDDGDAEGLPVSLLEGLAHGKLCVATYESGADDILVDGVNGFLVGERDVDGLSAALRRATRVTDDENRSIRTRAMATAAELSWGNIADRYLKNLFPLGDN